MEKPHNLEDHGSLFAQNNLNFGAWRQVAQMIFYGQKLRWEGQKLKSSNALFRVKEQKLKFAFFSGKKGPFKERSSLYTVYSYSRRLRSSWEFYYTCRKAGIALFIHYFVPSQGIVHNRQNLSRLLLNENVILQEENIHLCEWWYNKRNKCQNP